MQKSVTHTRVFAGVAAIIALRMPPCRPILFFACVIADADAGAQPLLSITHRLRPLIRQKRCVHDDMLLPRDAAMARLPRCRQEDAQRRCKRRVRAARRYMPRGAAALIRHAARCLSKRYAEQPAQRMLTNKPTRAERRATPCLC